MSDYDTYRLHLLAKAIMQLNEKIEHPLEQELLSRLEENFQYIFGDDYREVDYNDV